MAERSPANLECSKSLRFDRQELLAQRFRILHKHRSIGANAIAVAAAQESADWLLRGFPQNVPHGYIDRADRVGDGAATPHPECVGMKLFADSLRFQGILPHRSEERR